MTIESSKIGLYAVVGDQGLDVTKIGLYAIVNPAEPMHIAKVGLYAIVDTNEPRITLSEHLAMSNLHERVM